MYVHKYILPFSNEINGPHVMYIGTKFKCVVRSLTLAAIRSVATIDAAGLPDGLFLN
jgi:hypothetical protein